MPTLILIFITIFRTQHRDLFISLFFILLICKIGEEGGWAEYPL